MVDRDKFYGFGVEICRIQKNVRDVIRVSLRVFNGREIIDARVFAVNTRGALAPTKAGVAVSPHLIADLIQALTVAERTARQLGWNTAPKKDAPIVTYRQVADGAGGKVE
jgi:Transcriptional Coactivator p15 (PC4)